MSVPKNLAKRQKLARKRQRKQQSQLKHRRPSVFPAESFRAEFVEENLPRSLAEKFPGGIVHVGAVGNIKMSEVLDDFVEPFAYLAEDEGAYRDERGYRRLLMLGSLAWNAALAPPPVREEMIADVLGGGLAAESEAVQSRCRQIVDQLVERKLRHFANYQRPILDFVLRDTGKSYYLSVISGVV